MSGIEHAARQVRTAGVRCVYNIRLVSDSKNRIYEELATHLLEPRERRVRAIEDRLNGKTRLQVA